MRGGAGGGRADYLILNAYIVFLLSINVLVQAEVIPIQRRCGGMQLIAWHGSPTLTATKTTRYLYT